MKLHYIETILNHRFFKYAVIGLILASLLPYFLSLRNEFVSDDIGGILRNPAIGQFSSVFAEPLNFIQPLLNFIVYKTAGLSPFFFRIPNLLFHTGTVLTLFLAVSMLFGIQIGFFSALLFAVHPLNSEAVVWISAASYTRYAFLLMAALLAYFISLSEKAKEKKQGWYAVSFLFFLLALFSSEKAIIFPLVLTSFHLADRSVRTHLKNMAPFFFGAIVFAIPHLFNIGGRIADTQLEYGADSQILFNPFVQIPVAVSRYLSLAFFPHKLDFFHANLVLDLHSITLFGISLVLLVILFIKYRPAFFWLSLFFIALLPTLLPLRIASTVAERYAYLGTAGLIVALVLVMLKASQKWKFSSYITGVLILIAIVLAARTLVRTLDWQNEDTLALAGSKTSSDTLNNHLNLGNMYAKQGNYEQAARELHMALAIEPNYTKAYNNLGYVYGQMGQLENAMKAYEAGLKINPRMWEIHDNLAGLYTAQRMYDQALKHEILALEYSKNNVDLYLHLGIIYMQMGDTKKAKEAFATVLKFDPKHKQAKEYLETL